MFLENAAPSICDPVKKNDKYEIHDKYRGHMINTVSTFDEYDKYREHI